MIFIKEYFLTTDELKENISKLSVGDKVYLSGTIYTARDQAHKRLCSLIKNGEDLPFNMNGAVIYYAGPTPSPDGLPIGSCGPTTSSRMDHFSPILLDEGSIAMIGKGDRDESVYDSIVKNNGIYFSAIGGCGALIAKAVKKSEIVAFEDLGCEAVRKLTVENLPIIVAINSDGKSIYR